MFYRTFYRTLFITTAALPATAVAQNSAPIEEIIVNADFRAGSLNDVPASISVLNEQLIEQQQARHLEELLINAPNVNMASGASRARFYQIRGIGERSQFTEPLNASVGILLDGVDFSGAGTATTLYDVEQVEILMGPQGTRYGSNALAGLINLQSKAPTETAEYGLQMEAGNYDSRELAGYASGPLGETLQYRIAAQTRESEGYFDNPFLERPTNQQDESTVRGKLRWQATDNTRIDLTAMWIDVNNGYDAFSLDNNRHILSDEPGFDRQQSKALNARLINNSAESFQLEAIFSLADSDIDYGYDEDWAYVGIHPDEYSSTDYYFRERDNYSAELRLLSSDNGRLFNDSTDWVVGVYRLEQSTDLQRVYTYLDNDFFSNYDIERLAVYGETSTYLNDRFSIDAGLRVERYEANYDDSTALSFRPEDTMPGGKLALNYHLDNDALFYISASRGYKVGGFNTDGSVDADLREYDPEFLWNYELGHKASWLNQRLNTRLSIFYMDRDDIQISSFAEIMREDGSTEFIDYTGNAATGFNYGLEFSADWMINDSFSLYTTLGLLESEYEDFINSAGEDLNGREQAHAPSWQFSLGANLMLLPNLELNLNLSGRDGFYYSDSHDSQSDAYTLANASLMYQVDNWRFTLWGRNLGDEDYYVRGFFFGNDPRDGYTAKTYTQLGEPRVYGLTVNADF